MKNYLIPEYKSTTGKDYYWIVIDKQEKQIFVITNASCLAHAYRFLEEQFQMCDPEERFRIEFSGTEIDENKIPKKYQSYERLPDSYEHFRYSPVREQENIIPQTGKNLKDSWDDMWKQR